MTEALVRAGVADLHPRIHTAVLADVTQALHLRLCEWDPLLRSTSVNVDAVGHPVEYGRTCFAGDRMTLKLET